MKKLTDLPATLVVNGETGEWVMTHNITRVIKNGDYGATVYVRADCSHGATPSHCCVESPDTPRQLLKKLTDPQR